MLRSLLALALLLAGCPTSPPGDAGFDADRDAGPTDQTVGTEERPARLVMPSEHDGVTPRPLIVLLHGYGASGRIQDAYLGLSSLARDRGIYLVLPDGTVDTGGSRFWNSGGACCDFGATRIDDVGYLTGLVDEVEALVPVDPDRIFFMGHSNGGFMSYRMACELSDRVAAIAVLAGSDFPDDAGCVPASGAPSVLHLHGTADDTIAYDGGMLGAIAYPAADTVIERWAGRMGCDVAAGAEGARLDLISDVDGPETVPTTWSAGCAAGREAALYRMEEAGHIPNLVRPTFTEAVIDWLLEHPR